MAGKSQTHEQSVLNVLRATNITAPATTYVGLLSTAPTDTTGGTEASGGGYARQAAGFAAPSGSPSQIANAADILFTMPTVTIVAAALYSAVTAGTLLYWVGGLSVAFTSGGQARIAASALVVQED